MFVPSTRERQKIPVSQITRGSNTARLSCSSKAIPVEEGYRSAVLGSSNGRNTNEEIADKRF
jgi:hypothetical protein